MGTTISAALWSASADTAALARIADAMRDTLQRLDSLLRSDPHGRTVDRFRRAALDSTRIAVRRHTGVELDLFLMANGYALDRATATLAGAVDSALLDLGGLFLWVAARGLTDRVVGIANPDNALETLAGVQLQRGALRTLPPPPSERLYETEEERARRPAPARGLRTVTVLAPTALAADAWAWAFFATGCDRSLALATRQPELRLSVVCADSAGVRWTPDLEGRVLLPTGREPAAASVPAPGPAPAPAPAGAASGSRRRS